RRPGRHPAAPRGLVRRGARRHAGGVGTGTAARRRPIRADSRSSRPRRPAAVRHRPAFGRLHDVMLYDCSRPEERDRGVAAAVDAVRRGDLVVLPTDTVYGIGADAFKAWAVSALLNAKGRGRDMPPPVLVGSRHTLDGLVHNPPPVARELVEAFW